MYLEIDEGFPGHRKTLRLCAALKNPEAGWYAIRLWTWACRSCPDGDLSGMEPYDIEIAIQYRPLDGTGYAALVSAGFVDEREGMPAGIHNWMVRTGAAIKKMESEATKKREWRDAHEGAKCPGKETCATCHRLADARQRSGNGQSADAAEDRRPRGYRTSDTDKTSQVQSRQDQSRSEGGPARAIQVPPAGTTEPEPPRIWSAGAWKARFSEAWVAKYGGVAYGGGVDAAKTCGQLDLQLAALPDAERLKAQARAPAMFAKYLGDRKLAAQKHPFRWFVDRFDALRTDAVAAITTLHPRPEPDRSRPEVPTYLRQPQVVRDE